MPIESMAERDQGFQAGAFTTSPKTEATSSTAEQHRAAQVGTYLLVLKNHGPLEDSIRHLESRSADRLNNGVPKFHGERTG